ncbi:MAG TPA: NUDIX domain-containing protein [Phycisphaerae bacterium]|nr:NUDIX domain-containing protein [Phycisphaerae bacterium]
MDLLSVSEVAPAKAELAALSQKATHVLELARSQECEAQRPFFFEFAGTPKSGKSTIIGIVSHFLHRTGFSVVQPVEGASLRTPETLRDDWLAFNAWSVCCALHHILEMAHEKEPPEIVLLDRGLFDAAAWMEFLEASQGRLSDLDRAVITDFLMLDLWRKREVAVFLFTADRQTSLARETHCKLTAEHGSVMNPEILAGLNDAYLRAAERLKCQFSIGHVDTSFQGDQAPSFQRIAYVVAERMLDLMHDILDQQLLVTDPVDFEGLEESPEKTGDVVDHILNRGNPRFMERTVAEKTRSCVQVVPYAYLMNSEGRYFVARRRADHPRAELRGTYTMLAGGHAEQKDWDQAAPERIFETCLQRELDEELIGLQIQGIRRIGVLNDSRSTVGTHHLAILFEVKIGGAPKVRRQATDQEFGREAVSWQTREEITKMVSELDPWSQLVAAREFGVELPVLKNEPTLFTRSKKA